MRGTTGKSGLPIRTLASRSRPTELRASISEITAGKEDVMYARMEDHLNRGYSLEMIREDCELRQHIGLFHTDSGPHIVRDSLST